LAEVVEKDALATWRFKELHEVNGDLFGA